MLRGGNMWFRPAIFIWFVFAQSFFKFHKNGDIRKLKAWSFRLLKNDFCKLYNEHARALQSSITIFLIHPVYQIIRQMYHGSTRAKAICRTFDNTFAAYCPLPTHFEVYCTSELLRPNFYNLNFKLWTKHMLNNVQRICVECNCVKKPKMGQMYVVKCEPSIWLVGILIK